MIANKRCLLIGGGLDSGAVALTLAGEFDLVWVDYRQKCAEEEHAACKRLAELTGHELVYGYTGRLLETNSDGLLFGLGENPIVKLRNLELIQYAACLGYTDITLALLNERGIMFPDANKHFMSQVGPLYMDAYEIKVSAPFITEDKWDFVCDADDRTPYFDLVYTCWNKAEGTGCGTCPHCEKLKKIREYSRTRTK
jgi:7-cyano-7-deazaguanine synthase in queuosine biosynthesis